MILGSELSRPSSTILRVPEAGRRTIAENHVGLPYEAIE